MSLATYEETGAFPGITVEDLADAYRNCEEHYAQAYSAADVIVNMCTVRPNLQVDGTPNRDMMLAALALRVQCEHTH